MRVCSLAAVLLADLEGVDPLERERVLEPERLRYRFLLPRSLLPPEGTVWSGVDSRLPLREGLAVGDLCRFPLYRTKTLLLDKYGT